MGTTHLKPSGDKQHRLKLKNIQE